MAMMARFNSSWPSRSAWQPELILLNSHSDPDSITLFKGWSRLTTTHHGEMASRPLEGFFRAGTQLVTHYKVEVDGKFPIRTLCTQLSTQEWCGVCLVPKTLAQGNLPTGQIPDGSLELRVLRHLEATWNESLRLRNYGVRGKSVQLKIELGCPIADVEFEEEMKGEEGVYNEGCEPEVSWYESGDESGQAPRLSFMRNFGPRRHAPTLELRRILGDRAPRDGEIIRRGVEIRFGTVRADCRPRFQVTPGKVTEVLITVELAPNASVDIGIEFVPRIEGEEIQPGKVSSKSDSRSAKKWSGTKFRTGSSALNLILNQAQSDLDSLLLPVFGKPDTELLAFNAGIPRYMGIFSRDILTTAWQAAFFSPKYLDAALSRVAIYRGVRFDPYRDEEPERIPHLRKLNPKAATGETNREVYYGDVVSTAFWIVTLAAAYNWTGDRGLLRRHEGELEACLRWLERRLKEGNGFLRYAPADPDSPLSNRNQAWKDSGDAIVDGSGRICSPPLATAEVQGYCFFALIFAAELSLAQGRFRRARNFIKQAQELKKRFNRAFWMEDKQFFALALDKDGQPVDAIASNIGHCLGTGLIDSDRIEPVIRRLMSPELFSGWGVRTLSTDNPAYDPYSYHRGSVWPVENSTIAAGIGVCGYVKEAHQLIESQFALATLFPLLRLPEVVSGHERSDEYPVPGLYPQANLLQAWSVSAIALEMMVLLGIRPFAPMRTLFVKPILPEWLPWVEVRDLHVGKARVSLFFWRDANGKSHWKVTEKDGPLWVIEQPPDLAPEATLGRRLREAVKAQDLLKIGSVGALAGAGYWAWKSARR